MGKTRFLSYTAANRYEKCGKLQWAYDQKQVSGADNIRNFFTGSVLHSAFEAWVNYGGTASLVQLYVHFWTVHETAAAQQGNLRWGSKEAPLAEDDRQQQYTKGLTAAANLEEDAHRLGLVNFKVFVEPKYRAELVPEVGMFAKPDAVVIHPSEPVLYVGELKSGSTYDPKQTDWYAAVLVRQPEFAGFRTFALAMRPNAEPRVSTREITDEKRFAQEKRATDICYQMADDLWPPKPGSYCGMCEARHVCPTYQATVVTPGQVGLGALR